MSEQDGKAPLASEEGPEPQLKVVDRRFWARRDGERPAEEPAGTGEGAPAYPGLLQELQGRLENTQSRLNEAVAAYQALQRGNDDFRQRLDREFERRVSLAKRDLLRGLLAVADNLERALAAAGADSAGDAPGAWGLSQGVAQVHSQLRRLLAAEGVLEIAVRGEPFDPNVAEAIEVRAVAEAASDGRVIEVVQRGYSCSGQMLRPARVVVGRAKP